MSGEFHHRKERLVSLSWCNYPKTLAFKIQGCIFLTVSKAYNCRARELGLEMWFPSLGSQKLLEPRGVSGQSRSLSEAITGTFQQ